MASEERPRRVAVIDNSIDPSVYRPVDHWRSWLEVPEAFVARDGNLPDLRQGFTHLILTGSEASINEREPWVEREAELVREATGRGLAILGSCWGAPAHRLCLGRTCPCPALPPARDGLAPYPDLRPR